MFSIKYDYEDQESRIDMCFLEKSNGTLNIKSFVDPHHFQYPSVKGGEVDRTSHAKECSTFTDSFNVQIDTVLKPKMPLMCTERSCFAHIKN